MSSIKSRLILLSLIVTVFVWAVVSLFSISGFAAFIIILPVVLLVTRAFYKSIGGEILTVTRVLSEHATTGKAKKMTPSKLQELGILTSAANLLVKNMNKEAQIPAEQLRKFNYIFDLLDEGIIIISHGLTVREINLKAKKLFAIEGFDPVGDQIIKTIRDQRIEKVIEKLVRNYSSNEMVEKTVRIFFPTIKNLNLRVIPVDSQNIAILIKDITLSTKLDNLRRDFVSNASHELKTPVAGIRLIAETIENAADDQEFVSKLLKKLNKEASNLSRLVIDLLNLSKLEELDVRFEDILVNQLVQSCLDNLSEQAEQKQINLGINMPKEDIVISGDHAQIEMMVTNILENAIAYSHDGGTVFLDVNIVDEGISISVKDKGIGIPSKHLDRIFERFYRVDKARSRNTGGTGLGLSIVRHAVENHNGKISVNSNLGEGSTFTIWLPAS